MSVLDRKFRRDFWSEKGMLSAIAAIIAVGVACLVGMLGCFNNLFLAKTSFYSRCRMADFWIQVKKAPNAVADELARIPGVSEIRRRVLFPVTVELDSAGRPISGEAISLPVEQLPTLNSIVLRRGCWFYGQRREQVIVSEKFAEFHHLSPGDKLSLVAKGVKKELLIVGAAISSEYMYMTPPGGIAPDPGGYGVFWLRQDFAEEVFDFSGACNDIVGKLTTEAARAPGETLDRARRVLDDYGVFAVTSLEKQLSNLTLDSELRGLRIQAVFLPAIFLAVAALVLNVVMTRTVERQRVIIGTLKAIGVTESELFRRFLLFGGAIGAIGGAVGCVFGYWLAGSMTDLYRTFFTFPNLTNVAYWRLFAIGLSVSVVCAVVGAGRGARGVLSLNPAEAMRPPAPKSSRPTPLERWPKLWAKLGCFWQMVFRGLFREKGRSLIAVTAAMCGSALMVLSLGLADCLDYMVLFQFERVMKSTDDLVFQDEVAGTAAAECRELPGVTYAEPVLDVFCHFENQNHRHKGSVTGLVPDAALTLPRNDRGDRVAVPTTGFLMTRRLAEKLRVGPGDLIRFIPVKGERRERLVPIAALIDCAFGLAVYADYRYLNRLIGESAALDRVQMFASREPTDRRALFRQVRQWPKLASLNDIVRERRMTVDEFVVKIKAFTNIFIGFAAVIFFGSILNAALVSVSERQREIATLRVLGYGPWEVGGVFFREILTLNLLGALLGLPVGYFSLYALAIEFQNDMYATPCVVQPITWVYAMTLAVIFIVGSYLIVQRVIHRLDWAEALKIRE